MEESHLGTTQKRARRLKATLVFIDETGLLLTPLVSRTWFPKGWCPVLIHRSRRARKVSVIGAVTISPNRRRLNFVCEFHSERSIKEAEVLQFLKDLKRQFGGPLILIWDRLQAHRSRVVREYLTAHPEITVEYLPPYAPDLNPVEQVWRHGKGHALANYCPDNVDELTATARKTFNSYCDPNQQHLLSGFIRHTGLPIKLKIPKRKHQPVPQ